MRWPESSNEPTTIRGLYPGLSETELQQAEENFERYIALAWRIYARVREDPEAYARFTTLTASARAPTIVTDQPPSDS